MTVKELIEELKKYDENIRVFTSNGYEGWDIEKLTYINDPEEGEMLEIF